MNIGLDLDNTIVRYDGCFHSLAQSEYLMPASIPAAKSAVRRFFRDSGRENEWTALQGVAYGRGMVNAVPFAGALDFIRNAFSQGVRVSIISHRTKHPIAGDKTDLHGSAREWLRREGFIADDALSEGDVFFEVTKEAKLHRIAEQGCTVFLDDLPEILDAELFPDTCEGWLFDPTGSSTCRPRVVADWSSFSQLVL